MPESLRKAGDDSHKDAVEDESSAVRSREKPYLVWLKRSKRARCSTSEG